MSILPFDILKPMLDEIRAKINGDQELLEKLSGVSDVAEVIRILKENGYDVSEEQLKSGAGVVELNDSELAQVAGGGLFSWIGNTCGSAWDTTDGKYAKCNPGDCG